MPFTAEKQRRICVAIEQTIGVWIAEVEAAHEAAIPGNKWRLLGLQRNMLQARAAIGRIMAEDGDSPVEPPPK